MSDPRVMLEGQRKGFAREGAPPLNKRRELLNAMRAALLKHQRRMAEAIATDFGGRSKHETMLLELFPVLHEIGHAKRKLPEWMAPQSVATSIYFQPASSRILYQPLGVVGIIAAWNYPYLETFSPLVSALAAGNRALIKPSELAPAAAECIRDIVAETYSAEQVSVVLGGPEASADFASLPLDHLLFTGSTRVGKLIMRAASENLTPVTLELGGKCPALVHEDADWGLACGRIVAGKLYNAGQTCLAPDYALVPERRVREFVDRVRAEAVRMYPRLVDNPDYTRIVNRKHYERIASLLTGAQAEAVNPAGEACTAENRVFPLTFVIDPAGDAPVMQEEIFGPVLPVIGYRTLEDAIAFVNARPRPLAFYYFDTNRLRIRRVLEQTQSGGVTVNDVILHIAQCALPFGGVGPSGMGRYHGWAGFQAMSNARAVFDQSRWATTWLFRPPFTAFRERLIRSLLR
jgi:coniferyl-aldehyde dehydrogenase